MKPSWSKIWISNICRPKQWKTIPLNKLTKEGYPVYGANGKIGFFKDYNHEEPTILITCRGATCGQLNICEPFSYVTGNAMALDDLDKERIDLKFLFYALQHRQLKDVISGSAQPQITRQGLEAVSLNVPEKKEQKRIAAILDKADAIRRKRKKAIQLADEFLRSVFLDMFGDPVLNPKKLPIIKVDDIITELRYGTSVKCHDNRNEEDFPVLRIPNILDGKVSFNDLKYTNLSKSEIDKLSLKKGDLLFVRTNGNPDYIGRCAVFEGSEKTLFASYLIRARLKSTAKYRALFLKEVVTFPTYRQKIIKETRTTAGNYNINTKGLKNLDLISPTIDLQDKFLKRVNIVLNFQKNQSQHLETANQLFNALAQRAFRGEL